MSLSWAEISAIWRKFREHIPIGFAFVGLTFVRAVLGWSLGITRMVPGFYLGNHIVVDAGELLGFLVVFIVVRKGQYFCSKPGRLAILGLAYGISIAALAVSASAHFAVIAWISLFVSGVCYAIMLIAWLEFYGLLSPGAMVFAYAASAALNALVWLFLSESTFVVSGVGAVLCAITGVLLLMWSLGHRKDVSEETIFQAPTMRAQSIPIGLILVWISILSFAFGAGDAITQMGYSTIAAKAGVALLGLVVVIGIFVLQDTFDSSFLYTAAIVCMVMGLAATLLSEVGSEIAQILLSAGHESCMLLAYFVVCARASRSRTTAAYGASIVAGAALIWLQIGLFSGSFILNYEGIPILFVIIIAAALTGGFLAKRQMQIEFSLMVHDDTEKRVQTLAHEKGLSDRETVVYILMTQGKNAATISEELFIAKSTVRAHMHRIYEKFGVTSRQDFDRVVLEERYR